MTLKYTRPLTAAEAVATSRACSKCGAEKSLAAFPPRKSVASGYDRRCRECINAQRNADPVQVARNRDRVARHILTPESVKRARVRRKTRRAVESGKLLRSDTCLACGERGSIQAHHTDYSRPYDVEWLCRTCHMARHRMAA